MPRKLNRSLYQCAHAHVRGNNANDARIVCIKGKRLHPNSKDGGLNYERLIRGAALEFYICQECELYEELGPPVPEEERGWLRTGK